MVSGVMRRGWGSGEAFPKEREAETHPLRSVATPQNGPREDHAFKLEKAFLSATFEAIEALAVIRNTPPLKRSRIRGGAAHPGIHTAYSHQVSCFASVHSKFSSAPHRAHQVKLLCMRIQAPTHQPTHTHPPTPPTHPQPN